MASRGTDQPGRIVRVGDEDDPRPRSLTAANVRRAETRSPVRAAPRRHGRRRRRRRPHTCRMRERRRSLRTASARRVAQRRDARPRGCPRPGRSSAAGGRRARRGARAGRDGVRRNPGRTRRPAASEPRSAASTAGEQPAVFSFRCSRRPVAGVDDPFVFVAHRVSAPFRSARRLRYRQSRIDAACAGQPLGVAPARSPPARSRRGRRGVTRCTVDDAHEVGRARARRAPARRRSSAARGSSRSRSRRRPARCSRRRTPSPPRVSRAARSPPSSQTTCSGAMRWLRPIASASVRVTTMPPLRASACARGPGVGHLPLASRARRRRPARRDGVSRIARASGSCSACAMRSAAIQAGRPVAETIDDLARPGEEVDRAVGRRRAPWRPRRRRCPARRSCRRAGWSAVP